MTEKLIEIANSRILKCPFCGVTYGIGNGNETVYRNISMLYMDKAKSITSLKCRQCKNIVEIKT